MISHRHKCIFVHITKAGGTSIEKLLWRRYEKKEANLWMGFVDEYSNKYQTGGLQHLRATQIQQEVEKEHFQTYFKFTIVRNPYTRAASQYKYMQVRPDLMKFIGMKPDCSFTDYLELTQNKEHVQWMPQYKFVCDDNEAVLVDYVGKLEEFDESLMHILKSIKYRTHLFGFKTVKSPHKNKSAGKSDKSQFTEDSFQLIREIYAKDFTLFGYDETNTDVLLSR